jgi:hypothetical protein
MLVAGLSENAEEIFLESSGRRTIESRKRLNKAR